MEVHPHRGNKQYHILDKRLRKDDLSHSVSSTPLYRKSSSLSFTSKSDAVCVPNISCTVTVFWEFLFLYLSSRASLFPFGTDRDSHNHSFICFLSSNILMLLSFHEQTEYQNILRNCLKCFGKNPENAFFPQPERDISAFSAYLIFLH